MATDVTMPRLSDSMEEGTVLKWIVEEGGEVKRGEPLVEIETDKANMTYEADTDGVLIEVLAKEGDTLAIGEVIARIGEPGETRGNGKPAAEQQEPAEAPEVEPKQPERRTVTATRERPAAPSNGGGERLKASPVARRMAEELGVELARLEGSGPGGRILKADVQAAADGGQAAPAVAPERTAVPEPARGEAGAKGAVEVHDLTRLQRTVSRRMAESKATAPDYALTLDVDMTRAVELRTRLKEVADPTPSYNDMVVKAAATALRENPRVNAAYRDGKFELYANVNVGVAVAAQDALVVPTIFDADEKSLGAIAREARRLIERVRDKQVTPPELSGGTFTVSNLGMFGVESFTAIINPPQAALLTVGALKKKPAVDDRGFVVARDQLTLTLVCDHRILYGADGARFLARVKELLEEPVALAL
ncbi:MAG TPA: dihydrolipoamide acetyltransferase family protein [Thermoleophilaceae bacterium]|nr:dihydrolipoamide acetyltransferase family protein [Thermoleophilaceae bacterium]